MKTVKMALLAGVAVTASAAAAHADELQDLKAQVEALNARVIAMEAAPAVPTGYQLVAISKGEDLQIPGMMGSDRDRVANNRATIISVMPTADAPAGTTISWSGYVRAAIVYTGNEIDGNGHRYYKDGDGKWVKGTASTDKIKDSRDWDDWDVKSRGQLRVVATTDTAVGEVGVELKMRADLNGNGTSNIYMKTAWGYWSMTPELTLGGGYTGSLGNIGYGYDGACTCYYTDNADVGFDPGDTTQMRLSYGSGPFSMAIALEDAGLNNKGGNDNYSMGWNSLGAAGEIKYSGDVFSGEISGVYRSIDEGFDSLTGKEKAMNDTNLDSLWQVGAGVGFNLGDIASLSLAAAMGAGPYETVDDNGDITNSLPVYNEWWGVSGLISSNLSDVVHAELAAGYKNRNGDNRKGVVIKAADAADKIGGTYDYKGFEYDTYAFLGGLYYTPVDQLTIGIEGEWFTQSWDIERTGKLNDANKTDVQDKLDIERNNWTVDLVSVWRF